MAYLQLHDGPSVFPSFTGKLQPLHNSYNVYAPGAPILKPGPFVPFAGCDARAEFLPVNAKAWDGQLKQIEDAKRIFKNFQSLKQAAGSGSVPIYDSNGVITGYKQGSKLDVALAWYNLGLSIGRSIKDSVSKGEARRLTEDAQLLWNQNKWGIQEACSQSLGQLQVNAQLCWDSTQWWIAEQARLMGQWMSKPAYARNNVANPQLAGQLRIANRAVVIRQNALNILLREIEAKGGTFTPGGGAKGGIGTAAILGLVVAAASALR